MQCAGFLYTIHCRQQALRAADNEESLGAIEFEDVPLTVNPSRVLAWAVPTLLTAGTLTFFLVTTMPRAQPASPSHNLSVTVIAMAVIALVPLGTLMYHLAARRSERGEQ